MQSAPIFLKHVSNESYGRADYKYMLFFRLGPIVRELWPFNSEKLTQPGGQNFFIYHPIIGLLVLKMKLLTRLKRWDRSHRYAVVYN